MPAARGRRQAEASVECVRNVRHRATSLEPNPWPLRADQARVRFGRFRRTTAWGSGGAFIFGALVELTDPGAGRRDCHPERRPGRPGDQLRLHPMARDKPRGSNVQTALGGDRP